VHYAAAGYLCWVFCLRTSEVGLKEKRCGVSASAGSAEREGISGSGLESSRSVKACCQQASATRQAATHADEKFLGLSSVTFPEDQKFRTRRNASQSPQFIPKHTQSAVLTQCLQSADR
jgi:hypothetical protein